jgi:hypothetical protein
MTSLRLPQSFKFDHDAFIPTAMTIGKEGT